MRDKISNLHLGNKVSQIRKVKGLSQEALAELSKVSLRTIQRIEKGNVNPHPFTVKMLAEALDLDTEILTKNSSKDEALNISSTTSIRLMLLCSLFCIIPLSNILLPLIVWIIKRRLDDTRHWGGKIISFQILWSLATVIFIFLTPVISYVLTGSSSPGDAHPEVVVYLVMVIVNISLNVLIAVQFNNKEYKLLSSIPSFL